MPFATANVTEEIVLRWATKSTCVECDGHRLADCRLALQSMCLHPLKVLLYPSPSKRPVDLGQFSDSICNAFPFFGLLPDIRSQLWCESAF
eukprot:1224637-Amphidinium_carterae.3